MITSKEINHILSELYNFEDELKEAFDLMEELYFYEGSHFNNFKHKFDNWFLKGSGFVLGGYDSWKGDYSQIEHELSVEALLDYWEEWKQEQCVAIEKAKEKNRIEKEEEDQAEIRHAEQRLQQLKEKQNATKL